MSVKNIVFFLGVKNIKDVKKITFENYDIVKKFYFVTETEKALGLLARVTPASGVLPNPYFLVYVPKKLSIVDDDYGCVYVLKRFIENSLKKKLKENFHSYSFYYGLSDLARDGVLKLD